MGAVQALSVLLPSLPADFPCPVFVVVHVPPEGKSALADLFAARCVIAVKEAEDKEPVRPGTVYFAPSDYHLLVEREHTIALSGDEPVLYSRPAIDVLFESAADVYGAGVTGIVLTGASSDGARGLAAVDRAGGVAVVQDPRTAEAGAMPRAALASCPDARVLSLHEIAPFLVSSLHPVRR